MSIILSARASSFTMLAVDVRTNMGRQLTGTVGTTSVEVESTREPIYTDFSRSFLINGGKDIFLFAGTMRFAARAIASVQGAQSAKAIVDWLSDPSRPLESDSYRDSEGGTEYCLHGGCAGAEVELSRYECANRVAYRKIADPIGTKYTVAWYGSSEPLVTSLFETTLGERWRAQFAARTPEATFEWFGSVFHELAGRDRSVGEKFETWIARTGTGATWSPYPPSATEQTGLQIKVPAKISASDLN
jgi:hypothetical protein